jgi:acyl-CoA synthetase (NDP forming)
MTVPDLTSLFRPESVVFIGASANPERLTGRPIRFIQRHGFKGRIQVVHPVHASIDGIPAVRSVADLDGSPDVAVVMLPAAIVPDVAEQCARKGVRHLVILSAGFEETHEGLDLAGRLRETADSHGMGIVGPNSEGLWFVPASTTLTFGSAADRAVLPTGPIAVISQSGSIGASITRRVNDSGLGANAFVSVGNETILDAAHYLDWLARNGEVTVIACFLEGLKNGRSFLEAAARARAAGVAVVVLQSGTSDAGRAASASHTGKIASAAGIYRSLFRQAGIIQVDSVEQLADAAAVLAGPRLRASSPGDVESGLTVIGLSGGSRSIIADAASGRGVRLAILESATCDRLRTFTPDFGVVTNPVDPTGQVLSDPELFIRTIDALTTDANSEALLIQYANGGIGQLSKHMPTLAEAVRSRNLPIMASCLLDQLPASDPLRQEMSRHGIGYAHDPSQAVATISRLYEWRAVSGRPPLQQRTPPDETSCITDWEGVVRFVTGDGIRTPRELVVVATGDAADIRAAIEAAELGGPLVVKASPDEVEHKSELGLIRLNVMSSEEVASIVAEFRDGEHKVGTVLVQEQVSTAVELLVVLQEDKDFGPVMGVGLGGFFVELLRELAYVSLPASQAEVEAALASTRAAELLGGYRGGRDVDLAAISAVLCSLGNRYARLVDRPGVMELNPVVIDARGDLIVLDALLEAGGEVV